MINENKANWVALGMLIFGALGAFGQAADQLWLQYGSRFQDYEAVVRKTHEDSLEARKQSLQLTVAKDSYWIGSPWGDTIWSLAALYADEKTELANKKLYERAQAFLDVHNGHSDDDFRPEAGKHWPFSFFGITEYVRILYLFGQDSTFYPGRLDARTERAMKESLWLLVKTKCRVKEAALDYLLVTIGTENHDLCHRPPYYLAAALFKDDPDFRDRLYDDGHKAADHYAAYTTYFQEWPRKRAKTGLLIELGSDTYQKYSIPPMINLYEFAPNPLVRKRFGMLLDLIFIEEAQISVHGRRGGGRSRAGYGKNNFEGYKNILYGDDVGEGGCSHSKVIETSTYQVPAAAIVLRKMAFPAERPFLIRNRVLGEIDPSIVLAPWGGEGRGASARDSALVNVCHRTRHYLLGSTLQNPALNFTPADGGPAQLKYRGISRQNRWSGMLFDDPEARKPTGAPLRNRSDDEMCAVFTEIEKTRGGRPQHPHWSFQHGNVLMIQRIPPHKGMGSYSTGRVNIRFHGKQLEKVDKDGWIFASNGKAFVGVKFLGGGHVWDDSGEVASPAQFRNGKSTSRILMHAGDRDSYRSFADFQRAVLGNPLTVKTDRVKYRGSPTGPVLECFRYDPHQYEQFQLPRIDGKELNLRPGMTFDSPILRSQFGSDKISVNVGPIRQVFDFGKAL